jgi:hypothetical protein
VDPASPPTPQKTLCLKRPAALPQPPNCETWSRFRAAQRAAAAHPGLGGEARPGIFPPPCHRFIHNRADLLAECPETVLNLTLQDVLEGLQPRGDQGALPAREAARRHRTLCLLSRAHRQAARLVSPRVSLDWAEEPRRAGSTYDPLAALAWASTGEFAP